MCGIIGYVGARSIEDVLLAGLDRLEYRGYDSAGMSIAHGDEITSVRAVGNLANLRAAAADPIWAPATAAVATEAVAAGIAHTRWATHGRVTEPNAHPHTDSSGDVHVVVNGIIENYVMLRLRLRTQGAVFTSETDAEVIAHLIAHHLAGDTDLVDAVRAAYAELEGHFSFVVMRRGEPGRLVAARHECPLVLGVGDGEHFVASAVPAFLAHTRRVLLVDNDEILDIRAEAVQILTPGGDAVERDAVELDWDEATAEKGGYETFMLKEIHEQPDALAETIGERTLRGTGVDFSAELDEDLLRNARRVVMIGCGTSYHAGLIGRYALEEWARIPVEIDIASEYRYRNPIVGPGDLMVAMSQSGETADTLAAMRLARERGAAVIAVTNVMGSQATRDSDGVLFTRAGLEVGVAATKTFVAQVAVMQLLALRMAELRGTLEPAKVAQLVAEVQRLPELVEATIKRLGGPDGQIAAIARRHAVSDFFLYLGRNVGLPVALEGALKLKEISYIATDAYAAGEMKHGPIALLSEDTPVVAVATDSPVLDKVVSNMQEVRARGAHVIAVATEGNLEIGEHASEVVRVPACDPVLAPVLAILPLQLLAYEIARLRGLNVDQPRNLAKTVTVE